MKRRFPLIMLLLALLLVVALTFTACGDGNDSAEGDDDVAEGNGLSGGPDDGLFHGRKTRNFLSLPI